MSPAGIRDRRAGEIDDGIGAIEALFPCSPFPTIPQHGGHGQAEQPMHRFGSPSEYGELMSPLTQ